MSEEHQASDLLNLNLIELPSSKIDDDTKEVLESLGKFKDGQNVTQIKPQTCLSVASDCEPYVGSSKDDCIYVDASDCSSEEFYTLPCTVPKPESQEIDPKLTISEPKPSFETKTKAIGKKPNDSKSSVEVLPRDSKTDTSSKTSALSESCSKRQSASESSASHKRSSKTFSVSHGSCLASRSSDAKGGGSKSSSVAHGSQRASKTAASYESSSKSSSAKRVNDSLSKSSDLRSSGSKSYSASHGSNSTSKSSTLQVSSSKTSTASRGSYSTSRLSDSKADGSKSYYGSHGSHSISKSSASKESSSKSSSMSHPNYSAPKLSEKTPSKSSTRVECSSTRDKSPMNRYQSSRSQQDRERSSTTDRKDNKSSAWYEREEADLQKRIKDLKKEISHEKVKMEEIKSRVTDYREVLNKSEILDEPYSKSASESSKYRLSHDIAASDPQKANMSGERSSLNQNKNTDKGRCSHGRQNSRSPSRSRNYGTTDIQNSSRSCLNYTESHIRSRSRSLTRRNEKTRRSRSRSCGRRRSRSKDSQNGLKFNIKKEVKDQTQCWSPNGSRSKLESEIKDRQSERSHIRIADENRNAMSQYMRSLQSQSKTSEHCRQDRSRSRIRSRSRDSNHHSCDHPLRRPVRDERSPSSVSSFDLDWPKSPHQPGVNIRAREKCLSPLSQLHASGETRIFKEAWLTKKNTNQNDASAGRKPVLESGAARILGSRLLTKREAQRNDVIKYWGERSIDCFEVIRPIGRGNFGQVYKAVDKDKNLLVAVKKIVATKQLGFPLCALLEITCLRLLDHPNIICLMEIARDSCQQEMKEITGMYYFVYEYVAHDLKGIIESKLVKLSPDNIACLMMQLLRALDYCHSHSLVHRNIKTSNILINYRGEVKMSQFGMARILQDSSQTDRSCTNKVGALWYRSPEVLLGMENYGTAIDMWSCGCVLGEIFQQKPLFSGQDDLHQLHLISTVCGSPNAIVWPDITLLPLYYTIKSRAQHQRRIREDFYFLPGAALDLLDLLLTLDPKKRCSAAEALRMEWLRDVNIQKMPPIHLPKTFDCHSPVDESKFEASKSEAVSSGMKRPSSSFDSFASQEMKAEVEEKRRKDVDKASVGLDLHEASARILEVLRQQPLLQRNTEAHSLKPVTDPVVHTDNSFSEKPAVDVKPGRLCLRVKDYQHQTVPGTSPTRVDCRLAPISTSQAIQRDNHLTQQDSQMFGSGTIQRHVEQLKRSLATDYETGFSDNSTRYTIHPGLNSQNSDRGRATYDSGERRDAPASSSISQNSAALTPSELRASEFWNAMKTYCSSFNASASRRPSEESGKQKFMEPFRQNELSSSSNTDTSHQPSMTKSIGYSSQQYGESMYDLGSAHCQPIRHSEDCGRPKVALAAFENFRRSQPSVSGGPPKPNIDRDERQLQLSSVREPEYLSTDLINSCVFPAVDQGKPQENQQLLTSGKELVKESSKDLMSAIQVTPLSRVHHVMPSMRAAGNYSKPMPGKESPSLFPAGHNITVTGHHSAASSSTAVEMPSQPGGERLSNLRPKLTGILKNRMEVKPDPAVEWKILQPKQ